MFDIKNCSCGYLEYIFTECSRGRYSTVRELLNDCFDFLMALMITLYKGKKDERFYPLVFKPFFCNLPIYFTT